VYFLKIEIASFPILTLNYLEHCTPYVLRGYEFLPSGQFVGKCIVIAYRPRFYVAGFRKLDDNRNEILSTSLIKSTVTVIVSYVVFHPSLLNFLLSRVPCV